MPKPSLSTTGRKRLLVIIIAISILGPLLAVVLVSAVILKDRGRGHWPAVERGRAFLAQGRPDLAFDAVQRIHDEGPGAGEAMTVAGLALLQFHEAKGARLSLERAIKLQPNQLDATAMLAEVYLRLGDGERGVQLLEAATKLDPSDIRFWIGIGKVRRDLGEPDAAANAYEQALKLKPGDTEIRLSLIADLLNSNQPLRATQFIIDALKDQPDDSQLLGLAARHARDMGKGEESAGLADRALAHDPDNVDALLVRAKSRMALGNNELALTDLEHVVGVSPHKLASLQLLAQVESHLGLTERAANTLARANRETSRVVMMGQLTQQIVQRPEDPEPRYQMGKAAAEGGQTLLAMQCFRAALILDPRHKGSQEALAALQAIQPELPASQRVRPTGEGPSPDVAPPLNSSSHSH